MECPVCHGGCLTGASDLLMEAASAYTPCPACRAGHLDKSQPPPARPAGRPCRCGRRFIDEVFLDLYGIFREEGVFEGFEPLSATGSPLLHPGLPMDRPPFLGHRSLVLLSSRVNPSLARRMYDQVPEVRGVVRTGPFTPGLGSTGLHERPKTYELLSGCDVRADIFQTAAGPVVIYKQQSLVHVEYPRKRHEKGERLLEVLGRHPYRCAADLCSGAGTLGLIAARAGVPKVILNDAWYPAAYWSAVNIMVNEVFFAVDSVSLPRAYDPRDLPGPPCKPGKIAGAGGLQEIEVWHADYTSLVESGACPEGALGILDLFDKNDLRKINTFKTKWSRYGGGELFIP